MQDLVAPMLVEDFFKDYYMQEPVQIRRGSRVSPLLKHLFSVNDLESLLQKIKGRKEGGEPSISRALSFKSNNGTTIDPVLLPSGYHPNPSGGDGFFARRLLANGSTIRLKLEQL